MWWAMQKFSQPCDLWNFQKLLKWQLNSLDYQNIAQNGQFLLEKISSFHSNHIQNADKWFFCLIWILIQYATFSTPVFMNTQKRCEKYINWISYWYSRAVSRSSHKAKHFSTSTKLFFPENLKYFKAVLCVVYVCKHLFSVCTVRKKSFLKHIKKLKTSPFASLLACSHRKWSNSNKNVNLRLEADYVMKGFSKFASKLEKELLKMAPFKRSGKLILNRSFFPGMAIWKETQTIFFLSSYILRLDSFICCRSSSSAILCVMCR